MLWQLVSKLVDSSDVIGNFVYIFEFENRRTLLNTRNFVYVFEIENLPILLNSWGILLTFSKSSALLKFSQLKFDDRFRNLLYCP